MKPGATTNPVASTTLLASLALRRPIWAILPFLIPISARYRGMRVPSTMVPFFTMVSNWGMVSLLCGNVGLAVRRSRVNEYLLTYHSKRLFTCQGHARTLCRMDTFPVLTPSGPLEATAEVPKRAPLRRRLHGQPTPVESTRERILTAAAQL